MRRRYLASFVAIAVLTFISSAAHAANGGTEDTDNRFVSARVVEVNERHISIIARTGVEHVIAVSRIGTRIERDGESVSLKELREGDVVTVELDELNPLKFAKQSVVADKQSREVAASAP